MAAGGYQIGVFSCMQVFIPIDGTHHAFELPQLALQRADELPQLALQRADELPQLALQRADERAAATARRAGWCGCALAT